MGGDQAASSRLALDAGPTTQGPINLKAKEKLAAQQEEGDTKHEPDC